MRRLNEIHLERGRLLERITTQRYFLAAEIQPVHAALIKLDIVRVRARQGLDYIKQHPLFALAAVAVLATLNIRRTLRLAQRGFFFWRTWRALRQQFMLVRRAWR